ncbi:MAG: aldehyde ferredoxin oxidoreductase N-terminal domain-containing protein [Dissulfuribacterales bacterium]
MATKYKGYTGKLLDVNLASQTTGEYIVNDIDRERFLGGRYLSTKILWDELKAGIDPLSPENILIVMTSPLTGTRAPFTSRYDISAKSPMTGGIGNDLAEGVKFLSEKYGGTDFAPHVKGDEYPIHQVPEPIAYAGSDRNFYDRYFFNGYSMEKEEFFAMALGVYPNLNIMDASFSVIKNGIQHNLRASKHLGMERMDTKVGPINIEVLEPLKSLCIIIDENEHGISADLTFTSRTVGLEEPRYTHRIWPKVLMDYTRRCAGSFYRRFTAIATCRERS